ncbi:uncharacterized protein LOC144058507 [Vanacampus margaritifer]
MSVTMTKAGGVTMLTLTSDSESSWPPLCQILCGLCYNPWCFSVSQRLRAVMGTSQSLLGALHIMVGLLIMGLGAILMSSGPGSSWRMDSSGFPYWLGALFILFGIIAILSEKFPSPCLVLLNAILNILGIGFAIAAIVLYSINMSDIYLSRSCRGYDYYDDDWSRRRDVTTTTSPAGQKYLERCSEGRVLILMLLRAINGVAIVLCVLELCLVISSCVLAIKSLCRHGNSERRDDRQQSRDDPEGGYKPVLEEVEA